MPKSVAEMEASMIANLEEKTGRSLAEWIWTARSSGFGKHGEIVKYLKSDHGMTHGYANFVALKALAEGPVSGAGAGAAPAKKAAGGPSEDPIAAQYTGAKAGLRPIYDALIAAVQKLGDDVEISPKKGYVSLRRNKQFAIVQPSTATRVDVGLNLKGVEPSGRLEKSGSFNAMVSHRVRIGDKKEVDAELERWLKAAYEGA